MIAKHAALFPEEWYLTSGASLHHTTEAADDFAQRYMAHLSYYEKHLAARQTEQVVKATLTTAYHLANNEPLSSTDRGVALDLLAAEALQPPCIAQYLAQTDLRAALSAHDARFLPAAEPLTERVVTEAPTSFDNPIENWHEWCTHMYGFTPLGQQELERAAVALREEISTIAEPVPLIITEPITQVAERLSDMVGEALDMHVLNATIVALPEYLKSMIPSAAAYSFARFEKPRRVTLLNMQAPWTLPTLTLLMAHETYAHLWHFAEVDAHASLSRRLPAMYRYTCTEGVALLVEEYVATTAVDALSHELSNAFTMDTPSLKSALKRTMLSMRLRRILRSLFEHYVYAQKMNPVDALARVLPLSFDTHQDLQEDLYAYLPTPGYASTYFHGFILLKQAGATLDIRWRKKIAETGFDIQGLAQA